MWARIFKAFADEDRFLGLGLALARRPHLPAPAVSQLCAHAMTTPEGSRRARYVRFFAELGMDDVAIVGASMNHHRVARTRVAAARAPVI
jgi:hypothetical protein